MDLSRLAVKQMVWGYFEIKIWELAYKILLKMSFRLLRSAKKKKSPNSFNRIPRFLMINLTAHSKKTSRRLARLCCSNFLMKPYKLLRKKLWLKIY